jgi:Tfp pilus assembly protein PilW
VIERFDIRREDGVTLVELLVATAVGIIVLFGVVTVVEVSSRANARTTARVVANQTARPVLTRIVDELHSTCVGPSVAPVLAGSDGSSISFINQTGDDPAVVPVKRTISLSGTSMNESVYDNTKTLATGGSTPPYTFSSTASSTQLLLTGAGAASIGGTTVPLFRYYGYDTSGVLSTTPMTTPLTSTTSDSNYAGKVVKVAVAFSVTPPKHTVNTDAGAKVSLSDSAVLRFTPASTATTTNVPCV